MENSDIRADEGKNTLLCIIQGYLLDCEIKICIEKLHIEVKKLKSGFTFIKDINEIKTDDIKSHIQLSDYIINNIYPRASKILTIEKTRKYGKLRKYVKKIVPIHKKNITVNSLDEAQTYVSSHA